MNFLYIFLLSIYFTNNKFVIIINNHDNFPLLEMSGMSGINGIFIMFQIYL